MQTHEPTAPARQARWVKPVLLGALVLVAVAGYRLAGPELSLDRLAARETQLKQHLDTNAPIVYAAAFLTYVAVTALSLPGAAVMTLAFGWFFGVTEGVLLVSFASTTGATVAFLLSRYLFRDALLRKFGDRLRGFNESLKRDGPFYLFTLRLIPAVPFFVINVVMGLTPIRVRTFWWVSQLGMLAGTCVYVYAGSSVPGLGTLAERGAAGILTPRLIVAFVLLGLFPLLAKFVMRWFGRAPRIASEEANASPASLR